MGENGWRTCLRALACLLDCLLGKTALGGRLGFLSDWDLAVAVLYTPPCQASQPSDNVPVVEIDCTDTVYSILIRRHRTCERQGRHFHKTQFGLPRQTQEAVSSE